MSKTVIYELLYDYMKPMPHGYKEFYSQHKTEDIYADIAKNVETRSETSNLKN